MRRVIVPLIVAGLAVTAMVSVPSAHAAARGAECSLSGTAKISPGLTFTKKTQKVTLSGVKLTGCHIGSASAAGVPKTYTATVTIPAVTSAASCGAGNLALKASIKWNTGKTTTANIGTKGLAVNQVINGKVASSTEPNIKSGDLVEGYAAFRPSTPAQNCVKPVTAVTFNGALALGSPK